MSRRHPKEPPTVASLPVLTWLPGYRLRELPRDLLAGLMGTFSTAPASMAFALLAGLPLEMGLYSLILPLLAYFLLGTCNELSLSPTATLAAVLGFIVSPLAGAGTDRYVALALLLTGMCGALLFVAGRLRLGYVTNFVSRPVLEGYFAGAAIYIGLAQVGGLLGIASEGRNLLQIAGSLQDSWDALALPSALLGPSLLLLLFLLHKLKRAYLGPPLAVIFGTLVVALTGIQVDVIGAIPGGLPPLGLPRLDWSDIRDITPGALAMALLIFMDSASVARQFAGDRRYRVDADQELRALGASNLVGAFSGAAPVSGNLADSVLLQEAGARTPMVGLVTVVLVLLLVIFGGNFPNIPLSAFAAIVIYAVLRMPKFHGFQRTWAFDKSEFWIGLICLVGVLILGLLQGLLVAVALTVLVLLARASHPRLAELALQRHPELALVDSARIPDAEPLPGALLVQPLGGLFFANAAAVMDNVRAMVRKERKDPLLLVVFDLRTAPFVDFTACDELDRLQHELGDREVRLLLARANPMVRDKLNRFGLGRFLDRPDSHDMLEALGLPPGVRDLT